MDVDEFKRTLLIVEDNPQLLHTFSRIFEHNGYEVAKAQTGKEAIAKLQTRKYDVALINYPLSDMEMTRLFPMFKKLSPKTVKIVVSSEPDLPDDLEGAATFLEKPVNSEKLLSVIDTALRHCDIEDCP
jgi:DNA-binding NtrC family response regulator